MDASQRRDPSQRRPTVLARAAVVSALSAIVTLLVIAAPARAANVFVQVTPSTVEAGSQVSIKASCTDNTMPVTVESDAFGRVTLQPQGGQLAGAAMVPAQTRAGAYRVRVNCPDGRTAVTMLNVVNAKRPPRGPATGFGGASGGDDAGGLLVGGGVAATALGAALGMLTLRRRVGARRVRRG